MLIPNLSTADKYFVQIWFDFLLSYFKFICREQYEPKLGGSAMNTVCTLKSLGTNALFFGACGEDDQSEIMYELLKSANMDR